MANTAALRLHSLLAHLPRSLVTETSSNNPNPPLYVNSLNLLIPEGLRRGQMYEVSGSPSSGRMAFCNSILAASTQNGELSAVVDTQDSFCPDSAERAGIVLSRTLWVQCNRQIDHAMRVADLLLHAGGFGVIWLDLCEVSPSALNRIPFSYWHRFRRAIEHTTTSFVTSTTTPQVKSSLVNRFTLQNAGNCFAKHGIWQQVSINAMPGTQPFISPVRLSLNFDVRCSV